MRTVRIALKAGESLNLFAGGNFFHLLETTAPITIKFIQEGAEKDEAKDMEFGFFLRPEGGFDALSFVSAIDQTIKIAVGFGEGGYNRTVGEVSVLGSVSVVEEDRARSAAGVAFLGGDYVATTAGQYGCIQLFNPVGSGKTLELISLEMSGLSGGFDLYVNPTSTVLAGAGASAANKLIGGAASSSKIRALSAASHASLNPGFVNRSNVPANLPILIELPEPIIIPAGYGVNVQSGTVSVWFNAEFEFRERAA